MTITVGKQTKMPSVRGIRTQGMLNRTTGSNKLPSDNLWRSPSKRSGKKYQRNQTVVDASHVNGRHEGINVTLHGWYADGKVKGEATIDGVRRELVKINANGVWAFKQQKAA